ncbi:MAG: HAMP domain-containing sensor histidine kinase [Candidatus Sericytochromatia bacterium]
MDKRRGIFIVNEKGIIVFYNGDLHEVSSLKFIPESIQNKSLLEIFNYEIVLKLSKKDNSGYFDYNDNKYIYKRKVIETPIGDTLFFLEIEGESDENVSFYSMLIHEIKNPLAAIRTLVQALSQHILGDLEKVSNESFETAKDYFDRLISEIDRLNRLLTSVKYISKHLNSLYVSFDIVKVAQNTIKIFENTLKSKEIQIETNFSSESYKMYGDPDQFHQIFNNLISNAIEAIEDSKGKIFINIYPDENKNTCIEVIDEGVGIDKNDLGKIFKAFYTKKIGGMGIGLTVVRMIVKNYKGTLDIQSNMGKGTKITISIPEQEKN